MVLWTGDSIALTVGQSQVEVVCVAVIVVMAEVLIESGGVECAERTEIVVFVSDVQAAFVAALWH